MTIISQQYILYSIPRHEAAATLEVEMRYLCDDGNAEIEIEATSARAAAEEYVAGGDWGDGSETCWIKVWVQEIDEDGEEVGERETHSVALEADEPGCREELEAHDWQSPYRVVGGIEENPGVWGHGGGVVITEVCRKCGRYRETDTWAQDPETGVQGLRSARYRDADEGSRAWVASIEAEASA